jgi:hypothetical protein
MDKLQYVGCEFDAVDARLVARRGLAPGADADSDNVDYFIFHVNTY